jgi:hypothetical protein
MESLRELVKKQGSVNIVYPKGVKLRQTDVQPRVKLSEKELNEIEKRLLHKVNEMCSIIEA